MIIYGNKAIHLKSKVSKKIACQSCGIKGSLVLSIYRKHAHVFWIPLFPIGKKGVSNCRHCKNVLQNKEMSDPLKKEYNAFKNKTKGPLWQFTGIALLAILIFGASYRYTEDKKLEMKYIAAPKIGDIYQYKIESSIYSTLKVVNAVNDSVFVSRNKYEINRISQIPKIDTPQNYVELTYPISKKKLKAMYHSGEIIGVKR